MNIIEDILAWILPAVTLSHTCTYLKKDMVTLILTSSVMIVAIRVSRILHIVQPTRTNVSSTVLLNQVKCYAKLFNYNI